MVATSRHRKAGPGAAGEVEARPNNQRTADGRRQLFGLAQAIREKAFKSTSPTSEAKQRNGPVHCNSPKQGVNAHTKLPVVSIEDRLKRLLNSDTEGPEENPSQQKKATLIISSGNRSKTPGPYVSTSYVRRNGDVMNGKTSQKERISFNNGEDEYVTANHQTHNQQMGHVNSQQLKHHVISQQKRCHSAVPASFNDKDWNKVGASPKYQSPTTRRSTPSPGAKLAWDPRKAPPPSTSPGPVTRPTSTGPSTVAYRRKPPPDQGRPVPALRRSLCFDNENAQAGARLVLDHSSNPSNASMRLVSPSPSQPRVSPYSNQGQFNHSTPLVSQHHPKPHDHAPGPNGQPAVSRQAYVMRATSSPSVAQPNMRRCTTPSPANRKSGTFEYSPRKEGKANPAAEQRTVRHTSPTQQKARHNSRDYYPQQNFSFRRAVHRSVSSESEPPQQVIPNDIKCSPIGGPPLSPGGDKCPRKSDDRDSGMVVEPEASVFDFDSSVLSDEDDVKAINETALTNTDSHRLRSPAKEDWSRSGTPILPPLSSDEGGPDPVSTPAKTHHQHHLNHSFSPKQNENVCMRNGKPENKVKPLRRSTVISNPTNGGAAELSPTESALSELQSRRYEQKSSKVISSKLQRGASAVRRGFHPRASSGDEKKTKKSRQRRTYDDSDVTDYSQQLATYKLPVGRKQYKPPNFRNPYGIANDRSEIGETSSVHSITTTSVCSSVLRKNGSRRHYRRHQLGSDKYSREIRSVTKRFTRLESHVVTLARSLAQLSSELRQQNVTSREIEQLRHQMQEIRTHQMTPNESRNRKSMTPVLVKSGNQPKITKLVKFFGEQPPLLNLFLKQLGYEKYIKNFECESIGMMELPYMDEKRLHEIGIPLGPRLRIMKEAQKSSYV